MSYGKELILDIHKCDTSMFTRELIDEFFEILCNKIDMERCDLHFWDYDGYPEEYEKAPDHLKGISATQFISTSTIVIHTLDILEKVFLNIFSCKDFDASVVSSFAENYFGGKIINETEVDRI